MGYNGNMIVDGNRARQNTTDSSGEASDDAGARWPLEKVLNLMAGTIVLSSLALGRRNTRWRTLTGFVGANLVMSGVVGWCPSSLILHRLGLRSRCELARCN